MMKPIEIARKLNVSTSALRHYESWGIVPEAERAPNGYRKYTEEHLAYFECIRKMNTGFGMGLIRKIMPLIRAGEITEALWLVNDVQVDLHQEKRRVEQVLHALEREELEKVSANRKKERSEERRVGKEGRERREQKQ